MKIAEALLLRKQLEGKVEQLKPIRELGDKGVFEMKSKRVNVNEQTDEISFQLPKISLKEITKEYDHYASELRKLDASIQKANWQYDIDYKQANIKK